MLVDWYTVVAQAINFLILVWLLRHFLYRPILKAIDAREAKIAAKISGAEAKDAAAESLRVTYQAKIQDMDSKRNTLLASAQTDAAAERKQLLEAAHKAADALASKRQLEFSQGTEALHEELTSQTQTEVLSIARKALKDLASASLEERMTEVFTRRLRELSGAAKAKLATAVKITSEPLTIRSAFELPPESRAAIQNAVNVAFSADLPLRFEAGPDLISGIELVASGQSISWSISGYIASLKEALDRTVLERLGTPSPSPPAQPKSPKSSVVEEPA